MPSTIYTVLPRIETSGGSRMPILIFPSELERGNALGAYVHIGQHCSASREYVRCKTRPPRTVAEWQSCLGLIEEERTLGPKEDWLEARIVTRLR